MTGIIDPITGILLFIVMQIVFIMSHTIVKWLKKKDKDKKTSFLDLLKEDFKNLSLPTILVSLSYMICIGISFINLPMMVRSIALTIVPTIISIIIHYIHNKNATEGTKLEIFGEGAEREGKIKERYPKICSYLKANNSKLLNDIIKNENNDKIINLLDCVEKQNVENKFFQIVSNYEQLQEVSDLTKSYFKYNIDNICEGVTTDISYSKFNIEEEEQRINKNRINKIFSKYLTLKNSNDKSTIEKFFMLHEEILNSFFDEQDNITNEEILKKLAKAVKLNCSLDDIFDGIEDRKY